MGGVVYPHSLTHVTAAENINYPNPPGAGQRFPGTGISDLALQNSGAFGLRLGHFLDCHPCIGFEIDYFHANTNFPGQVVTLTNPGFGGPGSFQEFQLPASVTDNTVAFNLVLRYPGDIVQPDGAVGIGGLFTTVSGDGRSGIPANNPPGGGIPAPPFSVSSADVMLLTQVGCRINVTESIFAFGEWRFNAAKYHLDNFRSLSGISSDFSSHTMFFRTRITVPVVVAILSATRLSNS